MGDVEMWSLVAGFLSATFVLPVIQQPSWSTTTRSVVTLAWCLASSAVTAYLTGSFTGLIALRDWLSAFLGVFVGAIAAYRGFAKPTGIAQRIEESTSPKPGRHQAQN